MPHESWIRFSPGYYAEQQILSPCSIMEEWVVSNSPSPFTLNDRISLANQFRILEKLDPDQAKDHAKKAEILESGYEGQYGVILGQFEANYLSAEDCRLVEKTLLLHSWLMDWNDKANIDVSEYSQVLFDANSESDHLSYGLFLYNNAPCGYPGVTDVVNAGHPTIHRWRKMVDAWENREHKTNTEADVSRIITAGLS